jgi:hypothetical protein
MVMLNDNYPHNPTIRILIVMRVLTVSTNVLSVNYTDEQGQVSARFFILLEMVENQKTFAPNGDWFPPVFCFPTTTTTAVLWIDLR